MTEFSPFSCPIFLGHPEARASASKASGRFMGGNPMLLRAEPGKQRPRRRRTQELARSSGPRKGVAEKGWLTQLDESWYDRRTTSTYETKKRSRMYVRGFARWKNSKEASEGQYRIVGTGQSAARGGGHSTVGVARRKSQRQQTHYLAYRGFTGVAV